MIKLIYDDITKSVILILETVRILRIVRNIVQTSMEYFIDACIVRKIYFETRFVGLCTWKSNVDSLIDPGITTHKRSFTDVRTRKKVRKYLYLYKLYANLKENTKQTRAIIFNNKHFICNSKICCNFHVNIINPYTRIWYLLFNHQL